MDPISYSKAAQQEQRIKKFVAEPDSVSGLVTVPSVVATGETVSIPTGRTLVHPNLQVDGVLDIQGTLFIPSGGTYTANELDVTVVKQNGSVVATEAYVVSAIDAIPDVIDATETVKGIVELATIAEVQTGTDTTRAVTPAGMKAGLNAGGTAPIYACRAWVNFNGTGTVAIRASGNVSSITDNGVGDYTVNFTTAMPDASYGLSGSCKTVITDGRVVGLHNSVAPSASSVRIQVDKSQGSLLDSDYVLVSLFR